VTGRAGAQISIGTLKQDKRKSLHSSRLDFISPGKNRRQREWLHSLQSNTLTKPIKIFRCTHLEVGFGPSAESTGDWPKGQLDWAELRDCVLQ
jgi:hypothetical protein